MLSKKNRASSPPSTEEVSLSEPTGQSSHRGETRLLVLLCNYWRPSWCAALLKCLEVPSRSVEHVVNTTFPEQTMGERNATVKWTRAQSSVRQNQLQLDDQKVFPTSHLARWVTVFLDIRATLNCVNCTSFWDGTISVPQHALLARQQSEKRVR